jgi:release factor glutamine methyltransferase
MTVLAAVQDGIRALVESGFAPDDARTDAAVIARHLLGWTLTDWAARNRDAAPDGFSEQLSALLRRRAAHEPVAYLTGVREFYGREFRVSPAVLIPRPETEMVIEVLLHDGVLSAARRPEGNDGDAHGGPVIVDVGTGSGCLAITLKLEWPAARVIGTDVSAAALAVARANADRLGADVEFVEASLLPAGLEVDVVVSNPPYVPERDRASLAADVRDFEPAGALFAGPDGLDVIRALVPAAQKALKPGGWLVMEIGAGQADAVAALVEQAGLALARVAPDLQGIPRVVVAQNYAGRSFPTKLRPA